jgi:hypothetical protein
MISAATTAARTLPEIAGHIPITGRFNRRCAVGRQPKGCGNGRKTDASEHGLPFGYCVELQIKLSKRRGKSN